MAFYKNILLADDDQDDIELFQLAVKEYSSNVQVAIAKDGRMLMGILEDKPIPDVIVLDLNMPRMSGYECLKTIRKNQEYNDVPIMIFSTSFSQKDLDYCQACGANYYAVKPYSYLALSRIVEDLCNAGMLVGLSHNIKKLK